ncbi:MAG: hypothetical protein ACTIAY_06675 [Microbacterium gubbeenense]|uniref:hypothetical protein n=1 Tax=Microbacterium gubbeenense TaxID=159896 RepID=UPI003F99E81E
MVDVDELRSWGSLALALVAGAIGLVTYVRSTRDRREAQARLVYVKRGPRIDQYQAGHEFAPGVASPAESGSVAPGLLALFPRPTFVANVASIPCVVHNGSDELVLAVYVQITDSAGVTSDPDWLPLGPLEPKSTVVHTHTMHDPHGPDGLSNYLLRVAYRDSIGRWWQRREGGRVRRLRAAPVPPPSGQPAGSWKKIGRINVVGESLPDPERD